MDFHSTFGFASSLEPSDIDSFFEITILWGSKAAEKDNSSENSPKAFSKGWRFVTNRTATRQELAAVSLSGYKHAAEKDLISS